MSLIQIEERKTPVTVDVRDACATSFHASATR